MQASTEKDANTAIVTTTRAADLLGVAVSTVQKWVELGRLESWKTPGGHRRIPLASIYSVLRSGDADIAVASTPRQVENMRAFASAPMPDGLREVVDEVVRLRATRASGLLDTPAHINYDRIVRIAALLTDMPVSLISLLDEDRQWFKARLGMSRTETPRSWAFCNYTILDDKIMIVEDALQDPRFANNPLVTGQEAIRFYAGVPLLDKNACRLGSLCVLDRKPRQLSHEQTWALTELATIVSEEIQRGP
ncbi:GAF domain-containing protein [Janthinobacterium sp. RB2R34]|uniref:GAF domain-containing protein n=1 Tax=Janthinobacterium sp. RB2R34 TaxID=3424193 RepID=UPI003F29F1C9